MYLKDSIKEKCLKIKEMSKVDWYIINEDEGEIETSLYNNRTSRSDASILVEIKEDNSLNISIIATSDAMFKKYQGKNGHELFENKMRDVLWNTKAEECISYSGIWHDSDLRNYEMFISDIKLHSYREILDILETITSTVAKFYTVRKVI